jgi:hypothetical protein
MPVSAARGGTSPAQAIRIQKAQGQTLEGLKVEVGKCARRTVCGALASDRHGRIAGNQAENFQRRRTTFTAAWKGVS